MLLRKKAQALRVRPARRLLTVLGAAVAVLLLLAAPASAHVTVSSPDASAGGFGKLIFRAPTESENASTVKISVTLPKDTPFAFVSSKSKPGWKVSMDKITHDPPVKVENFNLAKTVSTVTWTAKEGARSAGKTGIPPGEFDEFELSVGPFPKSAGTKGSAATLAFPAVQTYSDGSVAKWTQPMPKSGKEPEHPAPTLALAADAGSSTEGSSGTDLVGRTTGIAALVVALIALGLSLRRTRHAQ